MGDLDDAIAVAAEMANLDNYEVDFRRKQMEPFEAFISQLNANIMKTLTKLVGQSNQISSSTHFIHQYAEKLAQPLLQLER